LTPALVAATHCNNDRRGPTRPAHEGPNDDHGVRPYNVPLGIPAGRDHAFDAQAARAARRRGPVHLLPARRSFGYDLDMARVRAEFIGGVLKIVVPHRPTISAPTGYDPELGLGGEQGNVWGTCGQ
jgi:hypothetical protein